MLVCSTRDATEQLTFLDSLFAGLPVAGGLYQPCAPIDLRAALAAFPDGASFQQIATALTEHLLGDELGDQDARALVQTAFPFAPELHWLDDGLALLELFHGPTRAFKDFGAGYLAALVQSLMLRPRGAGAAGAAGPTGSSARSGPQRALPKSSQKFWRSAQFLRFEVGALVVEDLQQRRHLAN